MFSDDGIDRRAFLGGAAAGLTLAALGPDLVASAQGATRRSTLPLPSPGQVRADFQRMVDFGPRLTGSQAHQDFLEWLQREFVRAGAALLPCDGYAYERWSVDRFSLDVDSAPVRVATYFTRSQETAAGGITGPLVYGGALPLPSVAGTDLATFGAALAEYPQRLAGWASAVTAGLGGVQDSILLVDLPLPPPLTAGVFLPLAQYLHWPGHSIADWAQIDYSRSWILPGTGLSLEPFAQMGVKGVVFTVDRSFEALRGQYLPFDSGHEPLPALFVDRATGDELRTRAAKRPTARLTLTASRRSVTTSSVTAVLPGASNETLILNTHTDGQGFVEENGGVAMIHLARHFASLPARRRLKRTLVFAAWPGHMSGGLPELEGWIAAHPGLVRRAAAAMTIEHLGCTEWLDTADKGFHRTGENEVLGVWTTQGKFTEVVRETLIDADLHRTALLRPPIQLGVGGAFQVAGIPQLGAIAGPEYLVTVADNGDMDKLDERLAARQIAWFAAIARRLDDISAAELRAGDPTLGDTLPSGDSSQPAMCGPDDRFVADAGAGRGISVRFHGRRKRLRGVLLNVVATGAPIEDVTVELRRNGRQVAQSRPIRVTTDRRRIVLRRREGRRFALGQYSLVVRAGTAVIARRQVRLGRADQ